MKIKTHMRINHANVLREHFINTNSSQFKKFLNLRCISYILKINYRVIERHLNFDKNLLDEYIR